MNLKVCEGRSRGSLCEDHDDWESVAVPEGYSGRGAVERAAERFVERMVADDPIGVDSQVVVSVLDEGGQRWIVHVAVDWSPDVHAMPAELA